MLKSLKTRRLGMESLERRELLAPLFTVANDRVPSLRILPGGENELLSRETIRATASVGILEELNFAVVSGNANDLRSVSLMADGKVIATSYGYFGDLLKMNLNIPMTVGAIPRNVQFVASFSTYMQGDKFAVQLVGAEFSDLNGQAVPDGNVKYSGVKPVVHTLVNNAVFFSQNWQPEVATAFAGQKNIPVFSFQAWTAFGDKPTVVQNMEFVASQGNLKNGINYSLWQNKWTSGGNVQICLQSGVRPFNGKVVFGHDFVLDNGYQFEIHCDGANTLANDPSLSLAFGHGFKAKELKTNKQLHGVVENGGEGQIRISNGQSSIFNFRVAPVPGVYVSEIQTGFGWQVSPGAQGLLLDAFSVYGNYAPGDSAWLTQVVVDAVQGDLNSCTNFVLRAGNSLIANGFFVGNQVVFQNFQFLVSSGYTRLEVRADVLADPVSSGLQTTLKSVSVMGTQPIGNRPLVTDYLFRNQPNWTFLDENQGGGGVTIQDLLNQIAALQAQLLALQG